MYSYSPLQESEFRVLTILPAVDIDAEIRCELCCCELKEGTYNALSYVWGDPGPQKLIYIGEIPVNVTPNLFAALRRIRDTRREIRLWVDALCINQNDAQEKMLQVKRMMEIYAKAMEVFMWLGEEEDNSDLAMVLLQRLEDAFRHNFTPKHRGLERVKHSEHRNKRITGPILSKPFSRTYAYDTFTNIFREESLNDHWKALQHLFYRPYWRRVWIIQEIVMARNRILCCGTLRVSWNAVMVVVEIFSKTLHFSMSNEAKDAWYSADAIIKQFVSMLIDVSNKQKPSLLEGLARFSYCTSTDPRDNVYAILNLVESKGLEPDYTKTRVEVYKDVVRFIVEKDQALDILSACKPLTLYLELRYTAYLISLKPDSPGVSMAKELLDHTLPSWAPDWDAIRADFCYLTLKNPKNCPYKAGGSVPSFHFPNDHSIMIVDGVSLGTVQEMASSEASISDEWNTCVKASCVDRVYGDHNCKEEAFIRTLVAGRNGDGSKGNCGWTALLLHGGICRGHIDNEPYLSTASVSMCFKFGISDQGFMARIPQVTEKGDTIAIVLGAKAPIVLRRYEEINGYFVIGECCKAMLSQSIFVLNLQS